jgi:hypothetical protein
MEFRVAWMAACSSLTFSRPAGVFGTAQSRAVSVELVIRPEPASPGFQQLGFLDE